MGSRILEVVLVAGARPNFMKIAPLVRALERRSDRVSYSLIHTGQHYDQEMNEVFFQELGIPKPDAFLAAGGGTHAEQTAKMILGFERELLVRKPDWAVVVGDVNSTLACAIVAKKLGIGLAHVEAGLRSGDRTMPEEINRIVTDSISDLFFVTEPSGREHLLREGHPESSIRHVGHVMIDNLFYQVAKIAQTDPTQFASNRIKEQCAGTGYGVVTLHRPSNVDNRETLLGIVAALTTLAEQLPLIFPMHPRTQKRFAEFEITLDQKIHVTGPLSYMEFLNLWKDASVVLTDSGGLQEETTALGVRCVTLRESTERPVTIAEGTNTLAGVETVNIVAAARQSLRMPPSERRPALWDGNSADRIVQDLLRKFRL